MTTELEFSLIRKIAETYQASINLADAAKENARAAIEKAIECGQYLIEAKTACRHGHWIEWFSSHVTNFSLETASRYMRLANAVNDGLDLSAAASQRQAFQLAGILLEPSRDSGSQRSHGDSVPWLTTFAKFSEQIAKMQERAPVDEWPEPTRLTMKEKLRPLAELYQRL